MKTIILALTITLLLAGNLILATCLEDAEARIQSLTGDIGRATVTLDTSTAQLHECNQSLAKADEMMKKASVEMERAIPKLEFCAQILEGRAK